MFKPSVEYIKECFDYNHDTGKLVWKVRPIKHFPTARGCKIFNVKYAGKPAGAISHGYIALTITTNAGGEMKCGAHIVCWAILNGRWPVNQIDHINGNRSDNRAVNIREATNSENMRNCKTQKRNKTGFKGVFLHKQTGKYCAQINNNDGKRIHLGLFIAASDAHAAYCRAADSLHGEFANYG